MGSSKLLWVKTQCISVSFGVINYNRRGYNNRSSQERHKRVLNALGHILSEFQAFIKSCFLYSPIVLEKRSRRHGDWELRGMMRLLLIQE